MTAIDELDSVVAPMLADAGAIALRWFRSGLTADDKGGAAGYDPVTEADRGIEDLLRERLSDEFPDHEIVGEERGATGPQGRFRWLIDPIDGTKAFVSGSPLWGILLGLSVDGQPAAGWMHQPYLGETFAAIGAEAWFERQGARRPLVSRQDVDLSEAIMYVTFPGMFTTADERGAFSRLADTVRLVRFGGDCYSYCLLALGFVDLIVEASLQAYDIVPLIPIVQAAGGVVSDADGQLPLKGGFVVAAANPALHRQALAMINGA